MVAILLVLGLAVPVPVRSLYVWNTVDDPARLLATCERVGVARLYLRTVPGTDDEELLRGLIRRARARKIEVWAVPPGGVQDDWAKPFRYSRKADLRPVLDWLDRVIRHNEGHVQSRFAGVQLDVEPHRARSSLLPWIRTPVWDADGGNRGITREYLRLLDAVRERTRTNQLALAATVPPWFEGAEGDLAAEVQRRVDLVVVMTYVRDDSPSSRDAARRRMAPFVRRGLAEALFETQRGAESTLYTGGEKRLLALCESLQDAFRDNPRYAGCGAHHYGAAFGSGSRRWP